MSYNLDSILKLDSETRGLVNTLSIARVKVGLEIGQRMKEIEDNKLYERLDERSYPNFKSYIDSMGVNFRTIRELIGLYESFVLAGEYTIDELSEISYHRLKAIKTHLFKYSSEGYKLTKPKSEIKKWIKDAESDLTIDDLRQKVNEDKMGEHVHEFYEVNLRICRFCKLKERF